MLRIVSGKRWTMDGRWVVIGPIFGRIGIVCDPRTGNPWTDLQDCISFCRRFDKE